MFDFRLRGILQGIAIWLSIVVMSGAIDDRRPVWIDLALLVVLIVLFGIGWKREAQR